MKLSIYAGAPIQRALEGYENRSGRLNTVAERYIDIIARDCPALTEAEWCAVCDALNGYWMEGGDMGIRMAWAEVADADRLTGLGKKWGIDAQALAEHMQCMSAGGQAALAEVVERFWQRPELPTREALERAGARILSAAEADHAVQDR